MIIWLIHTSRTTYGSSVGSYGNKCLYATVTYYLSNNYATLKLTDVSSKVLKNFTTKNQGTRSLTRQSFCRQSFHRRSLDRQGHFTDNHFTDSYLTDRIIWPTIISLTAKLL